MVVLCFCEWCGLLVHRAGCLQQVGHQRKRWRVGWNIEYMFVHSQVAVAWWVQGGVEEANSNWIAIG